MVVEYVRALMQKKLVCRSAEERRQLAQQMVQDDQLYREIFHGLVSIINVKTSSQSPCIYWSCDTSEMFLVNTSQPFEVCQCHIHLSYDRSAGV